MTPPVVFFYKQNSPTESILKNDGTKESLIRLSEIAVKKNIDLRFVLGENTYTEGVFNNYWKYSAGNFYNIEESFTAQMIYTKSITNIFRDKEKINTAFLENITSDKLLTAEMFPSHVKKTIAITTENYNLETIKSDLIVLKPRYGNNGVNVQILPKSNINSELVIADEYIAQEFIDSSGGIPGLVHQTHEMRMYIFNGVIQSAYLRLPAANSYLANIAQGATEQQIDMTDIPDSFIAVARDVDRQFTAIVPRSYCIDIMNENGKPWIVELNSSPGLPDISVQPLADNYFDALLDLLTCRY